MSLCVLAVLIQSSNNVESQQGRLYFRRRLYLFFLTLYCGVSSCLCLWDKNQERVQEGDLIRME